MKTTLKIILLGLMAITLTTTSCSKDGAEGPAGPAGMAGLNGQDGSVGADGQDGTNGENGNTTIIASDWINPSFTREVQNGGVTYFDGNIAVPEITSEIVANGVVLVYGKMNGYIDSIWPFDKVALLPITLIYDILGVAQINTWNAIISEGNILIRDIENTDIHSAGSPHNTFRYVIIPSEISGKNSGVDFKKMSYQEVIDYLGLE